MKIARWWMSVLSVWAVFSGARVAKAESVPDTLGQKTVEFYEAMKRKDVAGMAALCADDLTYTSAAGELLGKQAYVENVVKVLTLESYKLKPVLVHVYGDAAVAVFRISLKATAGGQAWNPELTATDTWVKQAGAWKLAAHHVSPVMKR